jgi:type I restriction-modification system DNA methylase subunit
MKYTSIRIEGAILSPDILNKIEQGDISGQSAKDFGFDFQTKIKNEIARVWADAQDMWRIFNRQIETASTSYGTSETRKFWMIPLLGFLGYDVELSRAESVYGKSYAISHRAKNLDHFPVHIMGFNDNLDQKRSDSGPRMSPHALLQEYINLTEHLYAIVTNGFQLRILRDSSRLVKLSFIEFDLETMMNDAHFSDFALMYRLIHASRMPKTMDVGPESLIEKYHQDALDSGSRIREGLSEAVEQSIRSLANGFLSHKENKLLKQRLSNNELSDTDFYQYLLRLIYRLLFLMVIEERNLIYPKASETNKKEIYTKFYSVGRLRKLCEKRYLADARYTDLWISLKHTFSIFENPNKGKHLGIKPLAGDLFDYTAIGVLNESSLDNKILLQCLKSLSLFTNKNTRQIMRVNYGSLNVEEFGSVYEGLLEYDPKIIQDHGAFHFELVKGADRASSGSHYTPDELVQPLIKHSLDYIIEEKLNTSEKKAEKEKALLSIKVCDVACGSGHILLNAARRIGAELAKVRTDEDQPSPLAYRQGVRDVIQHCIYGVDKNPLAVELCKVAFWLEAHNPGEPLNFLDHHIKCGDAIVGLAHKEELENGIADEAFKKMPEDDKTIRGKLAKNNKHERKTADNVKQYYDVRLKESVDHISKDFDNFDKLPETTVEEIEHKREEYKKMLSGQYWWRLKNLADIQVAQFFIPKNKANEDIIVTDGEYRDFLGGRKPLQNQKVAMAMAIAEKKRFFHWFLEFPEVFLAGGFDCILGNPPYLGGQALSGTFGFSFCELTRYLFSPAKGCDLVTFFLRRNYQITKPKGFNAIITTNSITDGKTREGGLDVILKKQNGNINFAARSIRWPGTANLYVSLLALTKSDWKRSRELDGKPVEYISSFFEDTQDLGSPMPLDQNKNQMFQGSIFLGDGFLLTYEEKDRLIASDPKNAEVIFPVINGQEINSDPEQKPGRCIINFFDWSLNKASKYNGAFNRVEKLVKPDRLNQKDKSGKNFWWRHLRPRTELYGTINKNKRCFVAAATTKFLNFSSSPTDRVFLNTLYIYTSTNWFKFTILQSTIHNEWARKYSGSLETRLRYSPSDCFINFPFPQKLTKDMETNLNKQGEEYHEHRRQLMLKMQLGLTKTYNLFHTKELTLTHVIEASKQEEQTCESAFKDILTLRKLHKQMDEIVLQAYGWQDINLSHDFYEVDYLPENDRIRYTISPESRKEILQRLLKINHEIYEQEVKAGLHAKGKKKKNDKQLKLF